MIKVSTGRRIAGIAVGLLSGLALPLTLSVAQLALVPPILISLLWAWSGWMGAAAAALSTVLGCALMGGAWGGFLALAVLVAPGCAYIVLVGRRTRFYTGARWAVGATWAALFIALGAIWLGVRMDLADAIGAALRDLIQALPEALVDQMLSALGRAGVLGASFDIADTAMTAARRASLIGDILASLTSSLRLMLPAYLVSGGFTTALLGYALPLRVCQRRGDEPPVSLAPLSAWRLDANLIIGAPLTALTCYVAYALGMRGADAAYIAMANLAYLLFEVQGLGAVSRRLREGGVKPGTRTAALVLLAVLTPIILRVAGLLSALLGRRGLITAFLRKKAGKGKEE